MLIQFTCPHCGLPLTTENRFAGCETQCLRCMGSVTILGVLESDLTQPPFDYRSIAADYPILQIFWIVLWVLLFWLFYLLKGLAAGSETAFASLCIGIPLTLIGLVYVGVKSWRIKRILRKGGYAVGLLGTYLGQFRFDCPECNSPIITQDSFVMTRLDCPFCQADVIALPRPASRKVSHTVLQSEHWQYDYRAIVRCDRRMMLSLLSFFIGIAGFVGICILLFWLYSQFGAQGDLFHKSFLTVAFIFLGCGFVSIVPFCISALRLIGLLRLHLSIALAALMIASMIGLLFYIPNVLFTIRYKTALVLREKGYRTALWRSGMDQFAGHLKLYK